MQPLQAAIIGYHLKLPQMTGKTSWATSMKWRCYLVKKK